MKKPNLMFQGTASSVGKSVLVAGLCRILYEEGYKVAPFKAQNMSLNSFITKDGKEMGRAQVMQAEAAGIEPEVCMNPILIKPTGHMSAQYIIEGIIYQDMNFKEYKELVPQLKEKVLGAYEKLEQKYDIIILEGAGSPAEINLRKDDLVNMGMAELVDAPVILIGDIDKGGVFASVVGTLMLLSEAERNRVKGVIINKFRGDLDILKPGIKMLEELIHIPVLGIIPYFDLQLDDEDSANEWTKPSKFRSQQVIIIKVIKLPHIANFTDFNIFSSLQGIEMSYAKSVKELDEADLIIIPGSKNTLEDLQFLRNNGFDKKILDLTQKGVCIFGICGGFQMLGYKLINPHQVESNYREMDGLQLLDITTEFKNTKTTKQVVGHIISQHAHLIHCLNVGLEGYEIHMGHTISVGETAIPFVEVFEENSPQVKHIEGYHCKNLSVYGTYMHGIFDNLEFTIPFLQSIAVKKGYDKTQIFFEGETCYKAFKEKEYNKLAQLLRDHLDIKAIQKLLGGGKYENEME